MTDTQLSALIQLVRAHYENSEKPLLLSQLGNLLREAQPPISLQSFRNLKEAVKAAGESNVQIVASQEVSEYIAVVTPERRSAVESVINSKPNKAEANDFDALPLPVRIAFCVQSPDAPVYLRITRPVRYHKGKPAINPDEYRLVEDRFRLPGLKLAQASAHQKEELWHLFNEWLKANRLSVHDFIGTVGGSTALERFLSAQDEDILDRILIPGDIARLLARHD